MITVVLHDDGIPRQIYGLLVKGIRHFAKSEI